MKLILAATLILTSLNLSTLAHGEGTIVGGQSVSPSSQIAHRTVALYMVTKNNQGGLCTGTILNSGTILTAAHCVADVKAMVVIFAISNVDKILQDAAAAGTPIKPIGRNYRVATNFRALPGYSGQAGGTDDFSDLALVTFNGGLPAGYEPAQFLNQADGARFLTPGAAVTLAGYGITSVEERDSHNPKTPDTSGTLRQVTIKFAGFSPTKKNLYFQGHPGKDACSGDSGGPAMVSANGNVYIVGVASRSDCVNTSIYTWVPREKAARALSAAMQGF